MGLGNAPMLIPSGHFNLGLSRRLAAALFRLWKAGAVASWVLDVLALTQWGAEYDAKRRHHPGRDLSPQFKESETVAARTLGPGTRNNPFGFESLPARTLSFEEYCRSGARTHSGPVPVGPAGNRLRVNSD